MVPAARVRLQPLDLERPRGREEGRGQRDRDEDRGDDARHQRGEPDRDGGQAGADEQPPAPLRRAIQPDRDVALHGDSGRPSRQTAEDLDDGPGQRDGDGDGRDGDDHPGDAPERRAGREGDDHQGRVEPHPLRVHLEGRDPAVEQHLGHDQDGQDQRRADATRGKGREQHDDAREDGAEVRHEPAEEDDDRQRAGLGHTEDHQEDQHRDAAQRCPEPGPPQVAAGGPHRHSARVEGPIAAPGRQALRRDADGTVPVQQEVERQEAGEHQDGDDRRRGPEHAERARRQPGVNWSVEALHGRRQVGRQAGRNHPLGDLVSTGLSTNHLAATVQKLTDQFNAWLSSSAMGVLGSAASI